MRTADFDYALPPDLIAQTPVPERDQSRLLVLDRRHGSIRHAVFRDILSCLRPDDVLVLNDSRVIPARLHGSKAESGGQIEVLLTDENETNDWWVMLRPGKRVHAGTKLLFTNGKQSPGLIGTVIEKNSEGHCRLQFSGPQNVRDLLDSMGEIPLPPYITRRSNDPDADADAARYQTVYANPAGSVAAPTAGLHFTESLLDEIRSRDVKVCCVTLHIGPGTFAPVKCDSLSQHVMHSERYHLGAATAEVVNRAKEARHRVIVVGTSALRVLESVAADNQGRLVPGSGRTRLFIHPPGCFRIVDALLTNFHLPQSTLLMLVSAFAAPGQTGGRELILSAYAEAIRERYRFYSYGDAMLIL